MSIHNFTFHRKYYMQICNTKECREMERMRVRTDLALEERESFPGDGGEISGVSLREWQEEARMRRRCCLG